MHEAGRAANAPFHRPASQLTLAAAGAPLLTINGQPIDELSGVLKPPLVSFVVINWNYGRYVGATIDSIRAQDYPHFECLVIDNGSADDSRDVIERHVRDDARFTVQHFPENLGQLGAGLWALDRIRGGFVTFVDADDVLFPNFASVHLQVHLALPRSVGMSSSNIVETDESGNALTGGHVLFGTDQKPFSEGLRSESAVCRVTTVPTEMYESLKEKTRTIAYSTGGWFWGPGSSNMFRRSVLNLGKFTGDKDAYLRAFDSHFNIFCHSLAGTALIDFPLSLYRVHDSNYYAVRETVIGIRKSNKESHENVEGQRLNSVELMLENAAMFDWALMGRYWKTLDLQTDALNNLRSFYSQPRAAEKFAAHFHSMQAVFGLRPLIAELRRRFPIRALLKILDNAYKGKVPLSLRVHLSLSEIGRIFRRLILRQKSR